MLRLFSIHVNNRVRCLMDCVVVCFIIWEFFECMCRFKVFLFRVLVIFVNTVMCLSLKWILTRMTGPSGFHWGTVFHDPKIFFIYLSYQLKSGASWTYALFEENNICGHGSYDSSLKAVCFAALNELLLSVPCIANTFPWNWWLVSFCWSIMMILFSSVCDTPGPPETVCVN